MIVFAPLRTRRLDVRLNELPIGGEIALCHLPENAHEKSMTEFLDLAIGSAGTPSARHVTSPRAWTVSERLLVLAHYCVHTREDGPDYSVTEVSKLSDYLDMSRDAPAKPATFEALADKWELRPLIGAAVEVLESQQGESDLIGREYWMFGVMAAQLMREGEAHPDPVAEFTDYVSWLNGRMAIMRALPSSDFNVLFANYSRAAQKDTQFFKLWFDDQGVIVLPKEAGAVTPPARFLVLSGISELALSIAGKAQ